MQEILEILKYTLPSIVVMITAFFMLKNFTSSEADKYKAQQYLENNKQILPLRLQAYERVVLFLERISPEALSVRLYVGEMDAGTLQKLMIQTIRKEYEHNISQQVYVSDNAWNVVRNAKESLINIINLAATKVPAQEKSILLSREILNFYNKADASPVQTAIHFIKSEMNKQFG